MHREGFEDNVRDTLSLQSLGEILSTPFTKDKTRVDHDFLNLTDPCMKCDGVK